MAEKKWIDLETEDEGHGLRDWFIMGTILAGANSVPKLMAVNYLSQFEDLNGEFAVKPVFVPDFRVGIVPYSSAFLGVYNNVAGRMHFDNIGDGQNLTILTQSPGDIEYLVNAGAQLSRLYQKNKKNMEIFKADDKSFFGKVRECYFRDRGIVDSLAYRTNPLTADINGEE